MYIRCAFAFIIYTYKYTQDYINSYKMHMLLTFTLTCKYSAYCVHIYITKCLALQARTYL